MSVVAPDFGKKSGRKVSNPGGQVIALARLERSIGEARISFKRRGEKTVLGELHQSGCCKIRLPRAEKAQSPHAVLINTSGGLTDGDHISTIAHWEENTSAIVTTQAAERIYKSRGSQAHISNRISVEAGATGLWLPQETIIFDGGHICRRLDADIAEGGSLLACESTIFGRAAMGERHVTGELRDTWRVRYGGSLVFADGFHLQGDMTELLERTVIANGATAMATVIFAGEGAEDLESPMREMLAGASCMSGCSRISNVLVARLLATSGAELRRDLVALLEGAIDTINDGRHGDRASLPRVWNC